MAWIWQTNITLGFLKKILSINKMAEAIDDIELENRDREVEGNILQKEETSFIDDRAGNES